MSKQTIPTDRVTPTPTPTPTISADVERILVIDLSDSGQASVNFAKQIDNGRIDWEKEDFAQSELYFSALVLNSVLGGGYSSRLNQEIRIKRGLSYGAGSSFAWRSFSANFMTRTQTKNESAAEVAELVIAEIEKLINTEVSETELAPRKLVLTGDFGRDLETTQGLAERIADYYVFNLPITNLSSYIKSVNDVRDSQIKAVAKENFINGDIIIVGDYSKFKDDLAKRFPNSEIEVIKADELDLSKDGLQK
jgi:zinc protease